MSAREYPAVHPPKMKPVHPGRIVGRALEHQGVAVQTAANAMGVSRQSLYRVLNGAAGVSPDMAIRLGEFLGNGPGLWLRMQASYDLWHAQNAFRASVKVVPIASVAKAALLAGKRGAEKRARRSPRVKAQA